MQCMGNAIITFFMLFNPAPCDIVQNKSSLGHSKSRNEEMGKWEVMQSRSSKVVRKSMSIHKDDKDDLSIWHSLRDHLCLTVSIKGVGVCKGVHRIMVCKLDV